jgi:hypothetical protein
MSMKQHHLRMAKKRYQNRIRARRRSSFPQDISNLKTGEMQRWHGPGPLPPAGWAYYDSLCTRYQLLNDIVRNH